MAISTRVVRRPRVNGVYQAHDIDLGINLNNPLQHNVVILSIDEVNRTAKVKTITSLEKRDNNRWYFKNGKLDDVRNGNILVIPKNELSSRVLSGVNHSEITISLDKLHYKEAGDNTVVPRRYRRFIHRR